jgi:hypothetical protein
MVTSELSVVAHVSNAVPPGATFMGLAPTRNREPLSGVTPTTTDAVAVCPSEDVAVAVYSVAVLGVTLLLPEDPHGPVPQDSVAPPASSVKVAALELFQLSGAT